MARPPINRADKPVRPAILHNDGRAFRQADELAREYRDLAHGYVRPNARGPSAVLGSSYVQPVPIFQQLSGGHPSGGDDVREISIVPAQRRRSPWPSAGSTSATRPSGSGGTGLVQCSPPRSARDAPRTCAASSSRVGIWHLDEARFRLSLLTRADNAAVAHADLEGRRTTGSLILIP
jgi:hypothetical protein